MYFEFNLESPWTFRFNNNNNNKKNTQIQIHVRLTDVYLKNVVVTF